MVERTVSFVERIRVPATQDALFRTAIELACSTGRAVATADGRLVPAAAEGCDDAVRSCAEFADTLVALAMPGAVPRGFADLLTSITGIHGSLALVVRDATRLFIQGPEFRRFHGRGHRIFGEKSVNLLVAVNPIAVTGGGIFR